MSVLKQVKGEYDLIALDGFASFDSPHVSLGEHLYKLLESRTPVIGIAKSFNRLAIGKAQKLFRGESNSPVYITAMGLDVEMASEYVRLLHGPFRIPSVIKDTDQLSKGRHIQKRSPLIS